MSFLDRIYMLGDWTDISSDRPQSSCPCINSATRSYDRNNCNRAACSSPVFKSCLETHQCPTCGLHKLDAEFMSFGKLKVNCTKCRTKRREYKQMLKLRSGS